MSEPRRHRDEDLDEDLDDELDERDDPRDWQIAQDRYERWLDEIGGSR